MRDTPAEGEERATSASELQQLAADLADCRACRLWEGRTQVVFGVGDPDADLMFVGEGPGFHEDRQGEPFVGQAGRLLTELLVGIGLRREDVYIANVVKCRPPENRDPLPDEIEACSPNLARQIQVVRPRVICTLGRFATRLVAETEAGISSIRGRAKQMEVSGVSVVVLPVFHPAAALYTPANRAVLEEDFLKLRRLLDVGAKALKGGVEDAGETTAVLAPERQGAATESGPEPPRTGPAPAPSESHESSDAGPAGQLPLW